MGIKISWMEKTDEYHVYKSMTLYKPFVFRQLMPMLARALTWTGVPANWAIVLTMTAAGIGFYYALQVLMYWYYGDQHGRDNISREIEG